MKKRNENYFVKVHGAEYQQDQIRLLIISILVALMIGVLYLVSQYQGDSIIFLVGRVVFFGFWLIGIFSMILSLIFTGLKYRSTQFNILVDSYINKTDIFYLGSNFYDTGIESFMYGSVIGFALLYFYFVSTKLLPFFHINSYNNIIAIVITYFGLVGFRSMVLNHWGTNIIDIRNSRKKDN